jgi:hypothetical protein
LKKFSIPDYPLTEQNIFYIFKYLFDFLTGKNINYIDNYDSVKGNMIIAYKILKSRKLINKFKDNLITNYQLTKDQVNTLITYLDTL